VTGTAASLGGAIFTFGVGLVVDKAGYASVFWATGLMSFLACLALVLGVGKVVRLTLDTGAGIEPAAGSLQECPR